MQSSIYSGFRANELERERETERTVRVYRAGDPYRTILTVPVSELDQPRMVGSPDYRSAD